MTESETGRRRLKILQNWFTRLPMTQSQRKKAINWDDCVALEALLTADAGVLPAPADPVRCKNCGSTSPTTDCTATGFACDIVPINVATVPAQPPRGWESIERRACMCAVPDPVQQADAKFYCHACSFETGARPTFLEPESLFQELRSVRAQLAEAQSNNVELTHHLDVCGRVGGELKARVSVLEAALRDIAQYILPVFTLDGKQHVPLDNAEYLREIAKAALAPLDAEQKT